MASNTEVTSKLEFDVEMTCQSCANSINQSLAIIGIKDAEIDVKNQKVIVNSQLPIIDVLEAIENTGNRAVLKGFGNADSSTLGNAIAEIRGDGIMGVVRFIQGSESLCLIDGTIDGLSTGCHGLYVHEFGDLSQGCDGLGMHYNPNTSLHSSHNNTNRHVGDLGNIVANENGRATFRFVNDAVKVWDIIGRSLSVSSQEDNCGKINSSSSTGISLACAIIARSAGLFQNPKKICACDGVSLWDERDNPVAGESRGKAKTKSSM